MTTSRPLTILCVFTALACGFFIAAIWTGDGRFAATGGVLCIPALGALVATVHRSLFG